MGKKLVLLACLLTLLSACAPASVTPIVPTQPAASTFTTTSTPMPAPTRTPRPSQTPTLIVEEVTPTTAPMYVLECVNVPTGGYYINLTSRRTLHTLTIGFDLLETTGSFVGGQLPAPALSIDTSGGAMFGHTATELATCQTTGGCTATYESKLLYMKITCTL